ncbi:hypothetical protein YC2023_070639 [Brassica napus]
MPFFWLRSEELRSMILNRVRRCAIWGLRDSSLRVVEGTCSHWVELQQSRRSGSVGSIYVFLGGTRSLCLLCNLFQITGNLGFKSRRERFIKQLCRLQRKSLQGIFNMVQVNLARRGSS